MPVSGDEIRVRVGRVLHERARKHVGVAVGVGVGDTVVTLGRGRVGDDRPETPNERTIFEIGSITKVFTATLLADLTREGVVSLDDPVQLHLPADVRMPSRGRPITLADLATHTSGLPRLPKGLLRAALRERRNPYASWTAERLEDAIAATRPRRAPGKKIRYSNYGLGLLGYALERAAGTPYEELVAERIARPLGMVDTSIAISDEKRARLAQGHDRRGRAVPGWDLAALAGAGGLRSTVADLLRFLGAQLGEGPTGLVESLRSTHEPRARRGALSVGLGWFMLPVPGQPSVAVWHDGGTGGYRSVAGFVAASETRVVVLASSARNVDGIGLEMVKSLAS